MKYGCRFLSPNNTKFKSKFINCLEYSRAKSSINLNQYCYTIFFRSKGEPDSKYLIGPELTLTSRGLNRVFIQLNLPDSFKFKLSYIQ